MICKRLSVCFEQAPFVFFVDEYYTLILTQKFAVYCQVDTLQLWILQRVQ